MTEGRKQVPFDGNRVGFPSRRLNFADLYRSVLEEGGTTLNPFARELGEEQTLLFCKIEGPFAVGEMVGVVEGPGLYFF